MKLFRRRTRDREAVEVFAPEQIGPRRSKTPEGFLLCEAVPVARVGTMIYGAGEVPLEPGPDNLIRVDRDDDTLFDPKTLSSYAGKPVVDEHPDEDVDPTNWRQLAIGVVLNPRQGEGDDSDVMLADLLITDHRAIRDVDAGKREVSAGYDADYEQTGPGTGRQTNIIGNHVALVDRGRCGPRCAIGDHQPLEHSDMPSSTVRVSTGSRRLSIADRIRRAFRDAESDMLDSFKNETSDAPPGGGDEDGDGDTHIHIHAGSEAPGAGSTGEELPGAESGGEGFTQDDPNEARFAALEQGHAAMQRSLSAIMAKLGIDSDDSGTGDEGLSPGGGETGRTPNQSDGPANSDAMAGADPQGDPTTEDALPEELAAAKGSKTNDSAALETHFRAVLADAEILVPGFRMPTFDSKAKRKATVDSMCAVRRSVLGHMLNTTEGATLLETASGAKVGDLSKSSCVAVATLFRSAAGAKRILNNAAATRDAGRVPASGPYGTAAPKPVPQIRTLADLNALHAKLHSEHKD